MVSSSITYVVGLSSFIVLLCCYSCMHYSYSITMLLMHAL